MPKRFESDKKKTTQTISISPALKDWIQRYINEMKEKYPKDERYKSYSSFFCTVMENALEAFELGKTLDDFKSFLDEGLKNMMDDFTFPASVPMYENAVRLNRYTNIYPQIVYYVKTLAKFWSSNEQHYDSFTTSMKRMQNFFRTNNLVKRFNIEFTEFPTNSQDFEGYFEFSAYVKNIGMENCKLHAMLMGQLGFKILEFILEERFEGEKNKKYYYSRMKFRTTELFFSKKGEKEKRVALVNHNLSYIINYEHILNDSDEYMWIKMAADPDTIVMFKDLEMRSVWFDKIIQDLEPLNKKEKRERLLQLFEKLHWITIKNLKDLSFHLELKKDLHEKQIEFMKQILSNSRKIIKKEGAWYLE